MATNRAAQLEKLARGIRRCRRCRLCEGRIRAVPGEGPSPARVLLLGEAPGRKEDLSGRPFVGLAGGKLDRLLELAGLKRSEVFITSSVKCRPTDNRLPKRDELEICKQAWLLEQFRLVDPKIAVLLGATAIRQVLGEKVSLQAVHGQVRRHEGRMCLLTYHPAAARRGKTTAAAMEDDFRRLGKLASRHRQG